MGKLGSAIRKEIRMLLQDRVGLLIMYLMPTMLVFIITLVQDSAFRVVNQERISCVVIDEDQSEISKASIVQLKSTKSFKITEKQTLKKDQIRQYLLENKQSIALYFTKGFGQDLEANAQLKSNALMAEINGEAVSKQSTKLGSIKQVELYFDPVLNENIRNSISSSVRNLIQNEQTTSLVATIYKDLGITKSKQEISSEFSSGPSLVRDHIASYESTPAKAPNSTEHNVPAWSLFAMFFMVVSLGGNIVKERLSGSFVRLQTIPKAFMYMLSSKVVVYLIVAITQLTLLFLIGIFLMPLIGLPKLNLPSATISFIVVSLFSAFSAISFSLMIGVYAKTQEQANGFGAVSIIIFAAIGGIWVPNFVMPETLQTIGKLSPLRWCIDGYYTLFLKNGAWFDLQGTIYYLLGFISFCLIFTFFKLRKEHAFR
jgi:ABC-2 type transport system permease protein